MNNAYFANKGQGEKISSILSNIYLHALDLFIEQQIGPRTLGVREVLRSSQFSPIFKTKDEINTSRLPISSSKLLYVRFAEDFIIGVKGVQEYSEAVMLEIKNFLHTNLKLEHNMLVTNAFKDKA